MSNIKFHNRLNQGKKRRNGMYRMISKIILVAIVAAISGLSVIWMPVSADNVSGQNTVINTINTASLTADEVHWLTYMREEEKLARDVYSFLYDKWKSRKFNNITNSEQKHMDSIKTLLETYNIPDPAATKAKGEFTNPELQSLYNTLITQGSTSLSEAFKVGVLIEETDIKDLKESISLTSRSDIQEIYSNLLRGSENHLRAFSR
jgi:hypothetical protein